MAVFFWRGLGIAGDGPVFHTPIRVRDAHQGVVLRHRDAIHRAVPFLVPAAERAKARVCRVDGIGGDGHTQRALGEDFAGLLRFCLLNLRDEEHKKENRRCRWQRKLYMVS